MATRSPKSHHGYHQGLHRMEPTQTEHSALVERITETAGGPARLRVILLLAGVLALQSADIGSIGALARQLEKAFDIGNTQLGLLTTVTALVGAAVALPAGALADRSKRVRILSWAVAFWSLGMVASGLAPSYTMLLLARVALGVLAAVCGPMVASLSGDLFPAQDRSRIYGMILTGELLGTGVGLVIAAELGAVAGWRARSLCSLSRALCLRRCCGACCLSPLAAARAGCTQARRRSNRQKKRTLKSHLQPAERRKA